MAPMLLQGQMRKLNTTYGKEHLMQRAEAIVPVLVITAAPGEKLRSLRAGARDFVSKPLDVSEVLIRVHDVIEFRLLHLEMTRFCNQLAAKRFEEQRTFALWKRDSNRESR